MKLIFENPNNSDYILEVYFENNDYKSISVLVEARQSENIIEGAVGVTFRVYRGPSELGDQGFKSNSPWTGYVWKLGDNATFTEEEFQKYAVRVSASGTIVFGMPPGKVPDNALSPVG